MTRIFIVKTQIVLFCTALGLLASASINAQGWAGTGEVGLIKASGNSESESYNVGLNFKNEGKVISHEIDFSLYQASADNTDSAESLAASYNVKYSLAERSYLFAKLSYLDDEFDGFTEQSSMALGYGYKVFDSDAMAWKVGIGAGYRDTSELLRFADGSEVEGKDLSGSTFVLHSDYRNQLTANTEFIDTFVAEIGADNSYIENDASVVVAMNQQFALKAGVLIRHNTDPAMGSDKTDTITSINLVYNFN